MADLTTDIAATVGLSVVGDFKPDMPKVSGRLALLGRLSVRLQTPRGRFIWWPNFGTDIAQYLLSKQTPRAIAAAAQSECLKDEQVQQAVVTATVEDNGRRIRLAIVIVDSAGPFSFTLDITQARLDLVSLQGA